MKRSVYKSAMSHLKTSENFNEATYQKLMREMEKTEPKGTINQIQTKEMAKMEKAKKRSLTGWTAGVAACAVLAVGIFAINQNGSKGDQTAAPTNAPAATSQPSAAPTQKPPIRGKVAVNIDGVISEVSADGKSFKVGDLWVEVTDQTRLGSSEPTAAEPSEELLSKTFKVGNIVSGYTSQDVSTGKVTADVIYNNIPPQK